MRSSERCPGWDDPDANEPFTLESDRWLVNPKRAAVGEVFGWEAVKREQLLFCNFGSGSFTPLAFDHYFKSRTAEELKARAQELKRRRSGALEVAGAGEQEEPLL